MDEAIVNDFMLESHIFSKISQGFCEVEDGEKQIGEILQLKVIDNNEGKLYSGKLLVTRYKLVFQPENTNKTEPHNPLSDKLSENNYSGSLNSSLKREPQIPEYK